MLKVRDDSNTGIYDAFFVIKVGIQTFVMGEASGMEHYAVIQWDGRNSSHNHYKVPIDPNQILTITDLEGNQYIRDKENIF